VPFYSKYKEEITSVVKKREEGIRTRAQEMGRFPRSVNGETVSSQWLRVEAVTPM
jgi:hypothetical protein